MDDAEIRVHTALEGLRGPSPAGDWDDVRQRAARTASRRRRRHQARGIGGALVAVAVAVGGFVMLLPRGADDLTTPRPPMRSGTVGVLDRPQTEADRLPGWVLRDPQVAQYAPRGATSRLARVIDGDRYVVVRAGRPYSDALCLVVVPAVAPSGTGSTGAHTFTWGTDGVVYCTVGDVMSTRFLAFAVPSTTGVDVVGVVPDGAERVTAGGVTGDVEGNVFRLRHVGLVDPVVASGMGGERRAYIGLQGFAADEIPPDLSPRTSVFTRPRTAADVLPPRVAEAVARDRARSRRRHSPWVRMAVAATSRYVGAFADNRYWLLRDERYAERILFAYLTPGQKVSFGQVSMPTRAVPVPAARGAGSDDPGGPNRVGFATMVPDGFTQVEVNGRRVPITANFVRVSGIQGPGYTAVFSGPAGRIVMNEAIGAVVGTVIPSGNGTP